MEGMTISEMATALGLPRKTVEMRLLRKGHKPKCQEALYSLKAFEEIKNTQGKGRPKKSAADTKLTRKIKDKPVKKTKAKK